MIEPRSDLFLQSLAMSVATGRTNNGNQKII
jgi:hypothetical protein